MRKTMKHQIVPTTIILFGATGDLSQRKLFPSLYHLYIYNKLPSNFCIVGTSRKDLTDHDFRQMIKESISKKSFDFTHLDEFLTHLYYSQQDVLSEESYIKLNQKVNDLESKYDIPQNRIFYLALAPKLFNDVTDFLDSSGLTTVKGYKRLIVEKPFGDSLNSAIQLNNEISTTFKEHEIFRIDHYLGKDMIQNIEVIRFANSIFEPLWNNHYISNIQITAAESIGVLDRASYYDQSGALKDMFQNHLLQIVALLAMEPPISLSSEDIRNEKVKALKSIKLPTKQQVLSDYIRGQYDSGNISDESVKSYREEDGISNTSNTDTFIAAKIMIDNFRWAGVPFYIRTGKRMKEKSTRIVIEFKEVPLNLYYQSEEKLDSNLLIINVQPEERIEFTLNAKHYSEGMSTKPVKLHYDLVQDQEYHPFDAYESLLYDCLLGDSTNFTHFDELIASWNLVDCIHDVWQQHKPSFPNYRAGSQGPRQSELLLSKDGFAWWENN
ncbi:glucose-6-phosphate dehydrogenase [Abyssicoccus albus]|nr:glucose-6-phosphate dehydrogenase [Abyssicoccus albus]